MKTKFHYFYDFPLILILLGLINSYHNDVYLVIRDFYYFGSSIIVFYFGYSSGLRLSLKKLMKVIVQLGFLLALIYLVKFLMEKDIESFYQIRQQLGTASYLIIISLILLILSEKYSIEIFPKRIRNGLLVYFTAISILALSRTFLLVFIVLLICGLGLLSFNKYFIRNILVIICTVLIGWWSLSRIDGMEPYSFIGKLQSSLDEVTIQDYNPKQEIIYSWRGVEAYKGMQEFKAGSLIEKVVGHGFGKSADIGFEMTLDGKVFTSISKFHNGYISILLKTGILGVIVYFLFFSDLQSKINGC